ncbi:MAG: hypothetical protein HC846_01035 [Blastocatellia bacterium]|nr:hypothetical protein [Blastocatellia bacterium]
MKSKIWLMFSLILVLSGIALAQNAKKTVTNADLEKFKEKRLQTEAEYRAKYKELGMPSPEELEQRNAEDKRRLAETSQRIRAEQRQNQDYWQSQAIFLRNEIASVNAQINFLNRQIAATPTGNKIFYSVDELNGLVIPSYNFGYGYGHRGRRHQGQTVTVINPANNVQTAINAAAANPNPYYGTPLYQTGIKAVIGPNLPRRGYGRNYGYGAYYPYVVNNGNLQREEIISRLQYLGQVRAGLLAQWNNLVSEARRAGVRLD